MPAITARPKKRVRKKPVLPDRTMNPAHMLAVLDRHPGLKRHPIGPEGAKYMTAFVAGNGAFIGAETTGTSYATFWIEAADVTHSIASLGDIALTHYERGDPRISALKKYGAIWTAAAYRVVPRDPADIQRIVEAIATRPATRSAA